MDQKRVMSAVVLIPLILLFIFFAPPILWLVLVLAIGLVSLSEYQKLTPVEVSNGDRTFSYIVNGLIIVSVFVTESISFAMFLTFFLCSFYHIIKKEDHANIVSYFLRDFLGAVYTAVLPSYIMLIRFMDGRAYIYLLLITIWAVDSSAYYVGSTIGKNKLIPNISPKKTMEGTVGGIIGAIIVLVLAKLFYFTNFSASQAVIFGFILSITAQVGDLFESLLKRAGGVKDSGDLIPGHGGMLDRIDSLLFAAPAFFYFTLFLNL
jgi:phosphatidate cytidylyltransferase